MPRLLDPADFPTFSEFSPEDSAFHCIFPLAGRSFRRCLKPVNKRDRMLAVRLRELIVLSKDDESVLLDLEEYARLCCCVAYHRGQILKGELLASICRDWQTELRYPALSSHENKYSEVPRNLPNGTELGSEGRAMRQRDDIPLPSPNIQNSHSSMPLTRAATRRLRQDEPASTVRPTEFVPYKTGPSRSTLEALEKNLTTTEMVSGKLYCFSRESDPGMRKIGFTTKTVPERLRQWQKKCLYSPILEHQVHTPHAKRAESLVHLELIRHRRKETKCRHNSACVTLHEEWMEAEIEIIKAAMDRWATWLTEADPYDTQGRLKEEWRPHDAKGMLREEWKEIQEKLKMEGEGEGSSMSEALLLMMKARRAKAAPPSPVARLADACDGRPSEIVKTASEREMQTAPSRNLDLEAGASEETLMEMIRLLLAEVQTLGDRVQELEGAHTMEVGRAVAVLV